MTQYFVDATTGNDADDGLSEANAWQTIAKVNTEWGLSTFSAGDEILFKRGETWTITAQLTVDTSCVGSLGSHIVFGAYGSGARPEFDGDGNDVRTFEVTTSFITIRDIEIHSNFESTTVMIGNSGAAISNISLINVYIHDLTRVTHIAAFRVRYATEYVWIENCIIDTIGDEGIYLGQSDNEADRTRRVIIKDCIIKNCGGEAIDLKDGTANVFIYNCTFTGNAASADEYAISVGGKYHVIYECTFVGTPPNQDTAIYLGLYAGGVFTDSGKFCRVERCLFVDKTGSEGAIRVDSTDNEVINCTFISCDTPIFGMSDAGGGHTIKNNIFHDSITNDVWVNNNARYTFDYNCYSNGGTGIWFEDGADRDFSYVQATLGQEANGITTGASFAETGMYTLNVGSGCRNVGESAETVYDWNDEYSPSGAVDMGWKEYGSWHEEEPGGIPHRIFNSFFEDDGSFARFTGSAGAGVSAAGNVPTPFMGKRQLAINITTTANRYVYRTGLGNIQHFYLAFYLDADGLTMSSGDSFNLFEGRTSGDTAIVRIHLNYDGANKRIRAGIRDDAAAWTDTSYYNLSSGYNLIEIFWFGATDSGDNEGELMLWINDDVKERQDGLNNHNDAVDGFYIGAVSGLDAGTSGLMYIDAVQMDWIRRMGPYLGSTAYAYTTVIT